MFPAGLPGVGLMLLRVAVAAKAFACAASHHDQLTPLTLVSLNALAVVVCCGFLTPVVTVLELLVQLSVVLWLGHLDTTDIFVSVLVAAALTALGPGAYSVDAQRFGRRLVLAPSGDSERL